MTKWDLNRGTCVCGQLTSLSCKQRNFPLKKLNDAAVETAYQRGRNIQIGSLPATQSPTFNLVFMAAESFSMAFSCDISSTPPTPTHKDIFTQKNSIDAGMGAGMRKDALSAPYRRQEEKSQKGRDFLNGRPSRSHATRR